MQDKEWREERKEEKLKRRSQKYGSLSAGLIIILIGGILLLRQMDVNLPHWLFTWPMILVIVGLFAGIQSKFRDFAWFVIFGIGAFFLVGKVIPEYKIDRFAVPMVVMMVGLVVIFGPWRKGRFKRDLSNTGDTTIPPIDNTTGQPTHISAPPADYGSIDTDDSVDVTTIFGNVKKVIYSKNFKGGEVVSIFGGAELNLTQADMTTPISMEMVQVFGGAKLIIPAHWKIRSEAVAIFGGIEDKRPAQPYTDSSKVLVLRGTVLFGGIEIKSY